MIAIKHAVLADYAMVSKDGKLSIIGIFERLFSAKCPVVHPQMCLVLSFEADVSDAGRTHRLEFQLIDEDGNVQFGFGGDMVVAAPPSGQNSRFNHIVNLNNISFKDFGSYEFKVLIDGEVRTGVALKVVQATVPDTPSGPHLAG